MKIVGGDWIRQMMRWRRGPDSSKGLGGSAVGEEQIQDLERAEPTSVDIFNVIAGVIFARLYTAFPTPIGIDANSIALEVLGSDRYSRPHFLGGVIRGGQGTTEETSEGSRYSTIAIHSRSWLEQCGFIIRTPNSSRPELYVLSPKGFEALAAVPASLTVAASETKTLGKQLTSAATTAGDRVSAAVISNIVGQVIGAAARSAIGG
jgi:hypothetical protein